MDSDISAGHLLGGRVIHAQRRGGHRTGIEPVLLAAAVGARAGQAVLEAGCGSAAGLLCLAARVPGLRGVGVEIDGGMAEIAAANIRANGMAAFTVHVADIAAFAAAEAFDHAFANPPWHDPGGTASRDGDRERARRARAGIFATWAAGMARALRHGGTLSFVVVSAVLPDCLAAFAAARCGSPTILPLWPRPGMAAKLVVLQAVKNGRGPARLLPGLVLHEPDGSFTADADAILREGKGLDLRA